MRNLSGAVWSGTCWSLCLLVTATVSGLPAASDLTFTQNHRRVGDEIETLYSNHEEGQPLSVDLRRTEYTDDDLIQPPSSGISELYSKGNQQIKDQYGWTDLPNVGGTPTAQDNTQTFIQEPIRPKEHKTIKTRPPITVIISEQPQKPNKIINPVRTPLFGTLGKNSDSEELISNIIKSDQSNDELSLKNAYLTKFTTFNFTKLRNDVNKSILLEKKDNSSADISYLDRVNRYTNYSENHVASLKTILDPSTYFSNSQVSMPSGINAPNGRTFKLSDSDSGSNQLKGNGNGNPKDTSSTSDKKAYGYITDSGVLEPKGIDYITENQNHVNDETQTDFLGGQLTLTKGRKNAPNSDISFVHDSKEVPSDFVGGQYTRYKNNYIGQSILPEIKHDFVEGQFTNNEGGPYNKLKTGMSDSKPADFVGGQFIVPHSDKDQQPTLRLNANEFMGGQFVDGNLNLEHQTENQNKLVNKLGEYGNVGDQIKDEGRIKTEFMAGTTEVIEMSKSELQTNNNERKSKDDSVLHLLTQNLLEENAFNNNAYLRNTAKEALINVLSEGQLNKETKSKPNGISAENIEELALGAQKIKTNSKPLQKQIFSNSQINPVKPNKGMSSYNRLQTPFNNNVEIITTTNEPTTNGNIQEDIVYKKDDGDTEVIVSVSSSSNEDNPNIIGSPNIETQHKLNTYYIEDDGLLGNSHMDNNQSILAREPGSVNYLTELTADYVTKELVPEANNVKNYLNPNYGRSENDHLVSSILSDYVPEASSSNVINKHFNLPGVSPSTDYDDTGTTVDSVELYAGTTIKAYGGLPLIGPNFSSGLENNPKKINSTSKSRLSELCLPLTNEKYISLLDILSGPFYIDKNGKKVSMALRSPNLKNCTLNSKQCKIFVDLKHIAGSPLETESSIDLTNEGELSDETNNKKRQIKEPLSTNLSKSSGFVQNINLTLPSTTQKYEQGLKMSSENSTTFRNQLLSSLTQSNLSRFQNIMLTADSPPSNDLSNKKQDFEYSDQPIPSTWPPNLSTATYGGNRFDLFPQSLYTHPKYTHESDNDAIEMPMKQSSDSQKNRPIRMVEESSSKGEKCGCGSGNDILKSPFPNPFPNYKEFVTKRYDILKNIVHTVGDWAAN